MKSIIHFSEILEILNDDNEHCHFCATMLTSDIQLGHTGSCSNSDEYKEGKLGFLRTNFKVNREKKADRIYKEAEIEV